MSLLATVASAGGAASFLGAFTMWVHADGPTRLCAGAVAVFHRDKERRKDARAVLAATKRRRR
ncbi:hypothetical protein ACFU44_31350 [Nocardia rhizosphaerihabitans]|uniref:hypothetical protein n=1 Tax=Nocardia rhizosphaerihabitans TaxID=1691570 RepID=UPI003672BB06